MYVCIYIYTHTKIHTYNLTQYIYVHVLYTHTYRPAIDSFHRHLTNVCPATGIAVSIMRANNACVYVCLLYMCVCMYVMHVCMCVCYACVYVCMLMQNTGTLTALQENQMIQYVCVRYIYIYIYIYIYCVCVCVHM